MLNQMAVLPPITMIRNILILTLILTLFACHNTNTQPEIQTNHESETDAVEVPENVKEAIAEKLLNDVQATSTQLKVFVKKAMKKKRGDVNLSENRIYLDLWDEYLISLRALGKWLEENPNEAYQKQFDQIAEEILKLHVTVSPDNLP